MGWFEKLKEFRKASIIEEKKSDPIIEETSKTKSQTSSADDAFSDIWDDTLWLEDDKEDAVHFNIDDIESLDELDEKNRQGIENFLRGLKEYEDEDLEHLDTSGRSHLDIGSIFPEWNLSMERYYRTTEVASSFPWSMKLEQDERAAISNFLEKLSTTLDARGSILNSGSARMLAKEIAELGGDVLIHEPWMSYQKLNKRSTIDLGRTVTQQALNEVGFEKLKQFSTSSHLPTTERDLKEKVFIGDKLVLNAVRIALENVATPIATSLALTIDYVLACGGDRNAMIRVHDALKVAAERIEGTQSRHKSELLLIADMWRRLSAARYSHGSNSFETFIEDFEKERFDLRNPRSFFVYQVEMPEASKDGEMARQRLNAGAQKGSKENIIEPISQPVKMMISDEVKMITVLDNLAPDTYTNIKSLYGQLLSPVPILHAPDPDEIYARLSREFPWMDELNESVARAAALANRRDGRGFILPPTLLVGSPGIGKSRWAKRVSAMCHIPMHPISLAGVSAAKSIIGSERGWASARPSLPAYAFMSTQVGNPLIVVDEVDKTTAGLSGDPIEALLPMLEKETSKRYPDIYLLGNLDLSHVSWIFTANSISGMNQPLLDRVKVFKVSKPTNKHYPSIVNALVEEVLDEFSLSEGFEDQIGKIREKTLEDIERGVSIRSAGKNVKEAVSNLIWKKPSKLTLVT